MSLLLVIKEIKRQKKIKKDLEEVKNNLAIIRSNLKLLKIPLSKVNEVEIFFEPSDTESFESEPE